MDIFLTSKLSLLVLFFAVFFMLGFIWVTKGITNEYEGKLAAVKSFYSRVQLNPSSGSMSGISPAPKGTDAETAYPILAGQCAQTTLQVNLWQEWATQNGLIK